MDSRFKSSPLASYSCHQYLPDSSVLLKPPFLASGLNQSFVRVNRRRVCVEGTKRMPLTKNSHGQKRVHIIEPFSVETIQFHHVESYSKCVCVCVCVYVYVCVMVVPTWR